MSPTASVAAPADLVDRDRAAKLRKLEGGSVISDVCLPLDASSCEAEFSIIWKVLARLVDRPAVEQASASSAPAQLEGELESLSEEQKQLRRRVNELSAASAKVMELKDRRDADITSILRSLQADVNKLDATRVEVTEGLARVSQEGNTLDSRSSGLDGRLSVAERATVAVLGLDRSGNAGEVLSQAVDDEAFLQQLPRQPPAASGNLDSLGLEGWRERLLSIRSALAKPCPPWPKTSSVLPLPGLCREDEPLEALSTEKVVMGQNVRVVPPDQHEQDRLDTLKTARQSPIAGTPTPSRSLSRRSAWGPSFELN